ncbi:MAG: YebC/PmpR family DNA-binding transcriptional regulator [Candidatus Pacebacteria bacterium]|nr:YebC/PmpR family DNA-binding transcriptional regulator [Candidatus Paceibacterota bacterium]
MGSSHKKQGKIADNNAKKAKIFGKLVRLIQVEAKKSGGDVNSPGLAAAIKKAYKENMPKDTVERAIKKASEAGDTQPVMYEAYGPGGVGLIITGLTDNTNRTSPEIKDILAKNGGSFGTSGSVSWNFTLNEDREWIANTPMDIDEDTKEHLVHLIELLEDHDDTQDIYHSANI